MLALFQTIDLALNLYTWVLIGSAIFHGFTPSTSSIPATSS